MQAASHLRLLAAGLLEQHGTATLLMSTLVYAPTQRAALTLRAGYKAWEESRRQDAEDERSWAMALQDARMMADRARRMEAKAPR